jgi:hypothetical protein
MLPSLFFCSSPASGGGSGGAGEGILQSPTHPSRVVSITLSF